MTYVDFRPPRISWWMIAIGAVIAVGLLIVLPHLTAPQRQNECRPQPGYCDIDTDWRPHGDRQ